MKMSLLKAFSRLTLNSVRTIHRTPINAIQTTTVCYAEPLKKKKKLDPQVVKQREDRRRKKLEKQIRRLEKNARQLKPIDELEVPMELIDEKDKRKRILPKISNEELERRTQLLKKWSQYKHDQKLENFQIIDRLVQCQNKALEELRMESEELYQEAIQPDLQLVPFSMKGPVSTPPIDNYDSPDGEYTVLTRKWE